MTAALVIAGAAVGFIFSLSGVVGILRMPDVYCRIQCSSKTITMGALPVLLALVIGEGRSAPTAAARCWSVACCWSSTRRPRMRSRAPPTRIGVPMWRGAVADQPKEQWLAEHK